MTAINVQLEITPDQLLQGIEQLDQTQLAWLSARLNILQQKKREDNHREERISDLLQLINRNLPSQSLDHYDSLNTKFQQQTLSSTEHQQLLQYVEQIESLNAERIGYMIELASLWGITFQQVADRLGLQRQPYVI